MRVLHAKLANDLATVPILNPNPQSQVGWWALPQQGGYAPERALTCW